MALSHTCRNRLFASLGILVALGFAVCSADSSLGVDSVGRGPLPLGTVPTEETLPPTRDQTVPVTETATITPTMTSTFTPTPTRTPTPTYTPTPSPIRLPLVLKQLRQLVNGGFEAGASLLGWHDTGALYRAVVRAPIHSGDYAMLLGNPSYNTHGGCPVGEAAISQVIDVPAQGHPRLSLWYRVYSYDTVDWDYFAVDIAPWPGGENQCLRRAGCPIWEWPGTPWDSGWRRMEIALDDYRGQTIMVKLYNAMTNGDGWYNTWTYVDDVGLDRNP